MKKILLSVSSVLVILIIASSFLGCSSGLKKEEHELHQVLLHNLHFRRPLIVGAEPQANYGDWEYESHPRPDAKLDCQPYPALFAQVSLGAVRECLRKVNAAQPSVTVTYILRREIAPLLELEDLEEAPVCLQSVLKTLPVPREIFFQSEQPQGLACYNSRLAPKYEDSTLSLKKWLQKFRLDLHFPLQRLPETDEETLMLLETWSIAPFWNPARTAIVGKVVPDEVCKKCMGEQGMLKKSDGLPPQWP